MNDGQIRKDDEEEEEEEEDSGEFEIDEELMSEDELEQDFGEAPTQKDFEERIKETNVFIDGDPSSKYELLK